MSKEFQPLITEREQHIIESENPELLAAAEDIAEIARDFGLDPFTTNFEIVPAKNVYEVAAYYIPGRFSHWTFGKAYYQEKTRYDYGLSKIYELVINTNPSIAYLLENNSDVQNKLVIAHVFGHTDFFKHNVAFADTNRKMHETAGLHADRIRKYEFEHGPEEVEKFLDAVLSIEHNIDRNYQREWSAVGYQEEMRQKFKERQEAKKRRMSDYDDLFTSEKKSEAGLSPEKMPFPLEEEEDILGFIMTFSPKPLEDWQKDICQIVRDEAYYFQPQGRTKIMNEGWAVFWHRKIGHELFERDKLTLGEAIEWDDLHSGIARPSAERVNPYHLGWQIWEDIDRKFKGIPHPEGKVEEDWQEIKKEPSFYEGREDYDIFWVRENNPSDQAFLRSYLTKSLIDDHKLYTYGLHGNEWQKETYDPEVVRNQLIANLNYLPIIRVAEGGGDYKGNRELYLRHAWDGLDLDASWADKTLQNVHGLWGRPVHLENMQGGDKMIFSCADGKIVEKRVLEKGVGKK
ncbi:MAG: SpoVR family protein [Candidatus Levybacteria bacterium]|nr:SpoVR family protein [Candidatus Levybacteria bacterium]